MFQRAFSVSTREPAALLFAPGGHSPTGVFVAWCNVGTFVRLCFGVSCGIARARSSYAIMSVPVVAVVAMAWLWPCRGVAVVPWMSWRPWVWPWRGVAVAVVSAVFVSPSCGCDTPTNASVCNDFGGVCVVLVCYLTG